MALISCKECGGQTDKKFTKCPNCGAPAKKKTSLVTWFVAIMIPFWALSFFADGTGSGSRSNSGPSPKQLAMQNVNLDFKGTKGGFGSVLIADITITNDNDHQIKDIQIACAHLANSGTLIDSKIQTIFEIVPANGKKTVNDLNMGFIHSQAARTRCEIMDFEL